MTRETSTTPAIHTLPQVSFEVLEDPAFKKPSGVPSQVARSYGFNDKSDFQRPDSYIRYIEPLEIELSGQVEYDMDEQDEAWLDGVNLDRKKEQLDTVNRETFEIAMDRLEKDWFDLTKNIPKTEFSAPSEDSTCAICDDSEGENSNAIVFCDGCNLAVHQDCYGVPYIPEGQWLCRKCTVSPESTVSCVLCPNEGGAFKQTFHGEWVHLLCAIWIPETRVANTVFMEPVTGVDKIPKNRWKLHCSLCRIKEGACIQCSKNSCFTAFHATCARQERLLLPMKAAHGTEPVSLTCYCERHLSKEQQDARALALASEAELIDSKAGSDPTRASKLSVANKTARAYAKTYRPGPPLVPAILVTRLSEYCKEPKRKKIDFMLLLCRYWSLKREARRGAPLLKRLHLEPWTVRGVYQSQSLEEKEMKLQQLRCILADLTQLQLLAEQIIERERRKLTQVKEIMKVFDTSIFTHQSHLKSAFEQVLNHDRYGRFRDPVNRLEVPDYFDVIKSPMCWTTIENKVLQYEYWDVQAFQDDVNLVINNALLYNKPKTNFHKAALRLQKAVEEIFDDLHKSVITGIEKSVQTDMPKQPGMTQATEVPLLSDEKSSNPPDNNQLRCPNQSVSDPPQERGFSGTLQPDGQLSSTIAEHFGNATADDHKVNGNEPNGTVSTSPLIGDLEPPLSLLNLLLDQKTLQSEIDEIIVDDSPLSFLLKYEFAKEAPPPRPPTPQPPKSKRDRKSDLMKKKQERQMQSRESGRTTRAKAANVTSSSSKTAQAAEEERLENDHEDASRSEEVLRQETLHILNDSQVGPPTTFELGDPTSADAKKSQHRKRHSIVSGVQEPPLLVEEVNDQQSFRMFNEGWILPPDQKRRSTRTPILPVDMARKDDRPRKKTRTDPGPSRLSVVSSTTSGNQTLEVQDSPFIDVETESPDTHTSAKQLSEASPLPISTRLAARRVSQAILQHPAEQEVRRVVQMGNGKVVVEELDTPMIRRRKSRLKKEEKKRLAAAVQAAVDEKSLPDFLPLEYQQQQMLSVTLPPHPEYVGRADLEHPALTPAIESTLLDSIEKSGTGTKTSRDEDTSELSELSDVDVEPPRPVARRRGRKAVIAGPRSIPGPRPIRVQSQLSKDPQDNTRIHLEPGTMLEGGTLVWAKAASYPWWPSVVYEDDDPSIPRNVFKKWQIARLKRKNALFHFVRFFDSENLWQILTLEKMRQFGENEEFDHKMLAEASPLQKWKNAAQRQECVDAYYRARHEMETASEEEAENEAAKLTTETMQLVPEPLTESQVQPMEVESLSQNIQ